MPQTSIENLKKPELIKLADSRDTEPEVLWELVNYPDEVVSERAFSELCDRMDYKANVFKDAKAKEAFIKKVLEVSRGDIQTDYRITEDLVKHCIEQTKDSKSKKALEALLSTRPRKLSEMSDNELIEFAKTTDDALQLEHLVDMSIAPKKALLAIIKRNDHPGHNAKLAICRNPHSDDDLLWALIADNTPSVSESAFNALCKRLQANKIKDRQVRDDFIELALEAANRALKSGKKDKRFNKKFIQQCIKYSSDADIKAEWESLLALNESSLLEASYIILAQQTESQSQLQKLTESQFESVREIANKRLI